MNERLTYTNLPKAYCPNDTLKKWKELVDRADGAMIMTMNYGMIVSGNSSLNG